MILHLVKNLKRPESIPSPIILDGSCDPKNLPLCSVNFVHAIKTCRTLIVTPHWLHSRGEVWFNKKKYVILQYLILNLTSIVSFLFEILYDEVRSPTSNFIACSLLFWWMIFHDIPCILLMFFDQLAYSV